MIGYLSVAVFLLICAVVFALFAVVVGLIAEAKDCKAERAAMARERLSVPFSNGATAEPEHKTAADVLDYSDMDAYDMLEGMKNRQPVD